MKKFLLLFNALTLSAGLWADTQNVPYLYPVYNTDGDATSGIKEWKSTTVEAIVVTEYTTALYGGWYVVADTNVQTGGLVCQGDVRLILADGAQLTATGEDFLIPGIRVSGEGNSLTIYGQANQSGQLTAHGRTHAAGIGGGSEQDGSNITINGGKISIMSGPGGAGIGGGYRGAGSNIIINGGEVSADAGDGGAGIGGGGDGGFGSNIIINGGKVWASGNAAGIGGGSGNSDGFNITINGGDINASGAMGAAGIGGGGSGNGYNIAIHGGTIMTFGGDFDGEVGGAGIGGGTSCVGSYITITDGVVTAIGGDDASGIGNGKNAGGSSNIIVATRCIVKAGDRDNPTDVIENDGTDLASKLNGKRYVTTIDELTNAYNTGYAAGLEEGDAAGYARAKTELLGNMGEKCTDCTAVEVTDGTTTVKLYKPEKVSYIKVKSEE